MSGPEARSWPREMEGESPAAPVGTPYNRPSRHPRATACPCSSPFRRTTFLPSPWSFGWSTLRPRHNAKPGDAGSAPIWIPRRDAAASSWRRRIPCSRPSAAGWALLQLMGVGLVAVAMAAVRFGPAQAVIDRRRRSPLEHVEALAASLEGAGGVDTTVALIVAGLRRRLGRAGVLRPDEQQAWPSTLEL